MRLGGVLGMIVGPLLLLVVINLWKLGTFDPVVCDLKLAIGDISALLASGRQDKPLTIRNRRPALWGGRRFRSVKKSSNFSRLSSESL